MVRGDWLLAALGVTPDDLTRAVSAPVGEGDGLLSRLEKSGALSAEWRRRLEHLLEESLKREPASTFAEASELGGTHAERAPIDEGKRSIPAERDGQYRRLEELGRGAQSVVHRAIMSCVNVSSCQSCLEMSGSQLLRNVRCTSQCPGCGPRAWRRAKKYKPQVRRGEAQCWGRAATTHASFFDK
jgi:hypothetical protein